MPAVFLGECCSPQTPHTVADNLELEYKDIPPVDSTGVRHRSNSEGRPKNLKINTGVRNHRSSSLPTPLKSPLQWPFDGNAESLALDGRDEEVESIMKAINDILVCPTPDDEKPRNQLGGHLAPSSVGRKSVTSQRISAPLPPLPRRIASQRKNGAVKKVSPFVKTPVGIVRGNSHKASIDNVDSADISCIHIHDLISPTLGGEGRTSESPVSFVTENTTASDGNCWSDVQYDSDDGSTYDHGENDDDTVSLHDLNRDTKRYSSYDDCLPHDLETGELLSPAFAYDYEEVELIIDDYDGVDEIDRTLEELRQLNAQAKQALEGKAEDKADDQEAVGKEDQTDGEETMFIPIKMDPIEQMKAREELHTPIPVLRTPAADEKIAITDDKEAAGYYAQGSAQDSGKEVVLDAAPPTLSCRIESVGAWDFPYLPDGQESEDDDDDDDDDDIQFDPHTSWLRISDKNNSSAELRPPRMTQDSSRTRSRSAEPPTARAPRDPLSISRENMKQEWTAWPPVKLDFQSTSPAAGSGRNPANSKSLPLTPVEMRRAAKRTSGRRSWLWPKI